jgi:prepilin-type N-terminal cleavage/methylation domain-containing protein
MEPGTGILGVSLSFSRRISLRHARSRGVSAPRPSRAGFTLLELLVVIGVIAAVAGVVVIAATRTRSAATGITCLGNLNQITTALRSFAVDNKNRYPDPGAAEKPWEQMISKYLPATNVLVCPADNEIAPVTGSSYDWRDTTLANCTMAGRPFTDYTRSEAVLTIESLPGWHKQGTINVGRVDGSCDTMDANQALSDLLKPIR